MAGHYVTYQNGSVHFSGGAERTDFVPKQITINQDNVSVILSETLSSSVVYFIDGIVDLSGLDLSFSVPSTGAYIIGFNFDTSKLICSDDNYTLFSSEDCGNLLIDDIGIEVTGTSSKVFDLVSSTNNEAIEINKCNFNSCTSLGSLNGFRQYLENGTGRFGGTPELEFIGEMNGVRIDTSIVRTLSNITSLFKAGLGLTFSGRFITNINCDLPASGALIDFSSSNITNEESLILNGCFITREGAINASDTTIYPNINHTSIKSLWSNNTGLPNTTKYIKGVINSEVETVISVIDTYYPLLGSFSIELSSHFDEPTNGQFRLLSGNGTYNITGDISLSGSSGDVVDLRVTKSTDNGATFSTQVNHMRRVVNNFAGGDDLAFFPVSFLVDLKKDDRIRLEVENKTGTDNLTAILDSYLIVKQV
ncbi:hypothetical protein EP331_00245 [bacterium]|nr:MAG: hypothetical protein EP331_00245 [bacterium]